MRFYLRKDSARYFQIVYMGQFVLLPSYEKGGVGYDACCYWLFWMFRLK